MRLFLLVAIPCAAVEAGPPGPRVEVAGSKFDASLQQRYLDDCRNLQIQPSADVLIRLQLGKPDLQVLPTADRPFSDLDLQALVALLQYNDGQILGTIQSLDLSACSLGPAGILLVAELLHNPTCRLESLDLSNQQVGPDGMEALAPVINRSSSLRFLKFRSCRLADRGGSALVRLLQSHGDANNLQAIDLQNNYIGFHTCADLSMAALAHPGGNVTLELMGNSVLDEVFNSVSHGFGEILSIIGTVFLMRKVHRGPAYERWSMAVYCASLNVLYLCSTLFHAFFALGRTTVAVFKTLDHTAIFLLIAGSYTPLLGVVLRDKEYARALLIFMWTVSVLGIGTDVFYHGPYELVIRLSLYIALGWTIIICLRDVIQRLGCQGTSLLALGGVLYTGGVPFFVKGRHTFHLPDHTIWHLFVVSASTLHFWCIYSYATLSGLRYQAKENDLELEFLGPASDSEYDDKASACG